MKPCPISSPKRSTIHASGARLFRRADAARPFTGPRAQDGLGSNNWVLSGGRTNTGKPLLANDMHLGMTIPSIWFENHLIGGDMNVTGVSLPGVPCVIAGHNQQIAWGFTNGFTDVQDLFIEHIQRQDDGRVLYEYQGEWLEAQVVQEIIKVKGEDPVIEEVMITHHGPIINSLMPDYPQEDPLALRWTALELDELSPGSHRYEPGKKLHGFPRSAAALACAFPEYGLR